MAKYIFITGGVVSGLGKGISGSSLATLLKNSGYKVFMQKFDPYLNVDPGTMSPYQHGEVYVTVDGAETDLDLGHYERFIDENLTQDSNVTSGRVYQTVIENERKGVYEGATVQVIPHITNMIKEKIFKAETKVQADIIITEIGGTVGDIESLPFIEAIRQVRNDLGKENVMFVHVALVPYLSASHEAKTKPVQHSVKELLSYGIQPDIIIARTEVDLDQSVINKIALFCNIPNENVLIAKTAKTIYHVPHMLFEQNAHMIMAKALNLPSCAPNMSGWNKFLEKINHSQKTITVKVVGKYVELPDAYLSVIESLNIAGYENNVRVRIEWIKAQEVTVDNYTTILGEAQGILVPGGFGYRGVEGKILAAKYARENNIPYLGLCLGMQVAVIEFARNVCGLTDANSSEFVDSPYPVIDLIAGKSRTDNLGGTLRLGNYTTTLKPNTLAASLYQATTVEERHRHRYEFNNQFQATMEEHGMVFSGFYAERNLLEVIEIPNHKFFIASQYHPEFTSRPNKPNPLFNGFIKAIIETVN